MKRSERMEPVKRVLGEAERAKARDLGSAQRNLEVAEQKLKELQQYHADYLRGFDEAAKAGRNAMALRDFQLFIRRLEEAVLQQQQVVAQARTAVAGTTRQWRSAAQRVKATDSVLEKWRGDEQRRVNKAEQNETDERAQRGSGRVKEQRWEQ